MNKSDLMKVPIPIFLCWTFYIYIFLYLNVKSGPGYTHVVGVLLNSFRVVENSITEVIDAALNQRL